MKSNTKALAVAGAVNDRVNRIAKHLGPRVGGHGGAANEPCNSSLKSDEILRTLVASVAALTSGQQELATAQQELVAGQQELASHLGMHQDWRESLGEHV